MYHQFAYFYYKRRLMAVSTELTSVIQVLHNTNIVSVKMERVRHYFYSKTKMVCCFVKGKQWLRNNILFTMFLMKAFVVWQWMICNMWIRRKTFDLFNKLPLYSYLLYMIISLWFQLPFDGELSMLIQIKNSWQTEQSFPKSHAGSTAKNK